MESVLQRVLAVVGQPVAGHPTQFLIERALAAARTDWRCLTFEVAPEQFADALRGLRALGFSGANLLYPHQLAVAPLVDQLSETAALSGAVNCVRRQNGRLIGENTDGAAFLAALRPQLDPAGKRVVLLGAGAVARAIAVELARAGIAELTVVNRTPDRGADLARLVSERLGRPARHEAWQGNYAVTEGTDLVIHATPLGLYDPRGRVPVDLTSLGPQQWVADVIFNPPRTWLLEESAARGCRTLDGVGMLVEQTALNYRLWTGRDPGVNILREAAEEFFEL